MICLNSLTHPLTLAHSLDRSHMTSSLTLSSTWFIARMVSSMGVDESGRWQYTRSTYSNPMRFSDALSPSMMCLRDSPLSFTP